MLIHFLTGIGGTVILYMNFHYTFTLTSKVPNITKEPRALIFHNSIAHNKPTHRKVSFRFHPSPPIPPTQNTHHKSKSQT